MFGIPVRLFVSCIFFLACFYFSPQEAHARARRNARIRIREIENKKHEQTKSFSAVSFMFLLSLAHLIVVVASTG